MTDRLQLPASTQPLVPNPEQRAVIQAGADEWLIVVAGPGTARPGCRDAPRPSAGVWDCSPPDPVLSFSRSAVATLSKRLTTRRVDDQGVMEEFEAPCHQTFDSWTFRMLRQGGEVSRTCCLDRTSRTLRA
jgi:hypothetical protein